LQAPDLPFNEAERIVSLYALGLLDSEPDERFDRITRLAKSYFDFPVVLISLVDRQRQWFKSAVGLEVKEAPRNTSFCGHAILQDDVFAIPDATQDPRFANNPFVLNEPFIRSYYGIPLKAPDGHQVGTLCLIDFQTRTLTPDQFETLKDMGGMVEDKMALNNIIRQARAARHRELRLNAILQTELDAIVSIEPDGLIIAANPATEALFGYRQSELLNHKVDKIFHRPFLKQIHAFIQQSEQSELSNDGQPLRHEVRGVRACGEVFPMELSVSQIEIEDETQIILIMRDISERKAYEQQLQTLVDRLKRSQQFAHIGTWEWDMQTDELYWSDGAAVIFGLQHEPLNLKIEEFNNRIHPEDREKVADAVKRCVESRDRYDVEHRIVRHDGHEVWVQERGDVIYDDQGQPLKMLGVVIDIDAKKRAELELDERRQQLQQAQVRAKLGHWQANLKTGELYWSDVIYDIFGIDKTIQPSVDLFQSCVHPDDLHLIHNSHVVGEKTGVHDVVHRIVRLDGEVRWVHELADMVLDDDQQTYILTGTVQDITDLKRVEQELLEQQNQLRVAMLQAERASQAKSEFLSSMSHELRTPLNSILGFAQVLMRDKHLNELQQDSVQEIVQAGKHLLELINEVLDFARIESGQMDLKIEDVALEKVVQDCVQLLKPQALGKQVELLVSSGIGYKVRADRLRLKQVLLNLISNGIKYNVVNGQVKIDCQLEQDHVRVKVTDTGLGISPDKMQKLFTPFERLGQEGSAIEGSGIGLTISKTLIEYMGGDIAVQSQTEQPQQGTEFSITLPLAQSHLNA
jgi:PAS domain S-box-containing protein